MLTYTELPDRLKQIPDPPKQLYIRGRSLPGLLSHPCVTVVGSRKVTPYGQEVTQRLVSSLARAGVVIISGLALGVDAIAHRAALEAGGLTIAVLPSSLDTIHPAANYQLAQRIAGQGALVSEYAPGARVQKWNFVQRNRIASGLCDALLITEAGEKSGTLHTTSFALEQGRDVLAVPGNITSPTSVGTNNLIKHGATPVTTADDILFAIGVSQTAAATTPIGNNAEEQLIIDLLKEGQAGLDQLRARTRLAASILSRTLTMLEIDGKIQGHAGAYWLNCYK
ncbi:MAG TPA: DNA-processing protein DprA [Candidatus Saccharimonadales bacterium]|nr:DNA-processing protein DprA [Candidatus Saccharimonadales bacterium]